jgi:hypothetical protein
LNSGVVKVPAIEPIFCCESQKYGFFGFLRISLKRKNPGKFFSAQKKRLDKSNPNGAKFIAICGLIRELWAFKCFSEVKIR